MNQVLGSYGPVGSCVDFAAMDGWIIFDETVEVGAALDERGTASGCRPD